MWDYLYTFSYIHTVEKNRYVKIFTDFFHCVRGFWRQMPLYTLLMSGLDFLVLVLQSSSSSDLNVFLFEFRLFLTGYWGHVNLLFSDSLRSTAFLCKVDIFSVIFWSEASNGFSCETHFRKALHFLNFCL